MIFGRQGAVLAGLFVVVAVVIVGWLSSGHLSIFGPLGASSGGSIDGTPVISLPLVSDPNASVPLHLPLPGRVTPLVANGSVEAKPESYGCESGPCPRSLAYAVEGCTCAGEVYESSLVDAPYCCPEGFSYEECAESLEEEAVLESLYGSTEEEVASELVWVELQGWYLQVNEAIAYAVERVNENLAYVDYAIIEEPTCWNWSVVPGSEVMSRHAFAIAIDINPSTNPSCGDMAVCHCYNELITDMPEDFIDAFQREGFEWGGNWVDHPDPMHFEWVGWKYE